MEVGSGGALAQAYCRVHHKIEFPRGSVSVADQSIDTTTAAGRFFFHITAALAQMERDLIAERTNAGLQAARARGRLGGQHAKLSLEQLAHARELIAAGRPVKDVARLMNVDRSTLFRQMKASS